MTIKELEVKISELHNQKKDISFKIWDMEKELRQKKLVGFKRKNKAKLEKIISDIENSQDLTHTGDEWLYTFIHLRDDSLDKELLREYLNEYNFYYDSVNNIVLSCIGPAIIINDYGDVLDQESGKWIIEKNDYKSEDELKKLIREYQEKEGVFNSVVYASGRYGDNYSFVSLSEGE